MTKISFIIIFIIIVFVWITFLLILCKNMDSKINYSIICYIIFTDLRPTKWCWSWNLGWWISFPCCCGDLVLFGLIYFVPQNEAIFLKCKHLHWICTLECSCNIIHIHVWVPCDNFCIIREHIHEWEPTHIGISNFTQFVCYLPKFCINLNHKSLIFACKLWFLHYSTQIAQKLELSHTNSTEICTFHMCAICKLCVILNHNSQIFAC